MSARIERRARRALLPAVLGLLAAAPAARAQDSVIANPPVLGTMAIVRVQFAATGTLDTSRWYVGELLTTADDCTLLTFPGIGAFSFGHFRSVQTRARAGDPWRVVDPTWIHSRALGC